MPRRLYSIALLVIWIHMGLRVGCSPLAITSPTQTVPPPATPGPVISAPSNPSPPITVKMILSKAPKLNELVELDLIVASIADASNTTVSFEFPDSVVFETGKLDWKGELKTKEPLTLKTTIKITKEGQITLKAKAASVQSNGDVWADAAYIYLTVTQNAGMVGFATRKGPNQGKKRVEKPPSTNP